MPLLHFGGIIMATIPIYFSDLKEDAQKRLLETQGLKTPSEGNYDLDIMPLFELDFEEA